MDNAMKDNCHNKKVGFRFQVPGEKKWQKKGKPQKSKSAGVARVTLIGN